MYSYVSGFSIRRCHELGASVDPALMYNTARKCCCCFSMKCQRMVQCDVPFPDEADAEDKASHDEYKKGPGNNANVRIRVLLKRVTLA